MNKVHLYFRSFLVFLTVTLISSCNGQRQSSKDSDSEKVIISPEQVKTKVTTPKYGFNCSLLDSDGNLWFGSNGGGVFFFDGTTFTNYTKKNGLNSNQVFSIIEDKENNLWFGTQKGLTKYNGKRFEHTPLPYQDTTIGWTGKTYPVLSPNAAHSLATDNNDDIWIGTAGVGAYKYDRKNFKSYLSEIGRKQEDSLYHNWIPFIKKDNKGNMWFASMTHGGVSRFDGEKFTHFLIKDGLSDDMVRTIFSDKSGKLWFGFNGNRNSGLTVYDGNSFKTYSIKDGLCNQRTRAIHEDKNGNLWLGSHLGKLCVFDGENFTEFRSNGQAYPDILFILGDSEDNVWFGGVNGIWKFDGQTVIKMTTDKS